MNVNYIFAAIVVMSAIIVGVPIWVESYDPAPHGIIGVVVTLMWWTMPFMHWLRENWVDVYAAVLFVLTFASIRRLDLWRSCGLGTAIAGAAVYVLVYPSPTRLAAVSLALVNIWWSECMVSWPYTFRGTFRKIRAWYRGDVTPPAQNAPATQ